MEKRPYIIELKGASPMPAAQQAEVVEFVCQELDALYGGPWPVAMAMHAFTEGDAPKGLPWDKAWHVIELLVLEKFDLPESAVLEFDMNDEVLKAETFKHLKR